MGACPGQWRPWEGLRHSARSAIDQCEGWWDSGAGRRAVDFQKTLTIAAPVEEVFARWTNLEAFPRIMAHVRDVKQVADGRYRWVVDGIAGLPAVWDAVVTQFVPYWRVIAWRKSVERVDRRERWDRSFRP